jgi:uncharacterized membrane protein
VGASKVLFNAQVHSTLPLGEAPTKPKLLPKFDLQRVLFPLYGLALLLSISTWFIAIRAPFWLDENVSMFAIKGGFSQILSRQVVPGVPAYPVILWLWTKVVGESELLLRMSSVLAMLGAAFLLYLAAKELLIERDVAVIAAVFFCLHPIIYVEATDVRPYPFAALAITACVLILVRLRDSKSNWLAAAFGLSAAFIVYFHYLFMVILPAILICFVVFKSGDRNTFWRQLAIAMLVFGLAFLPVIPGLEAIVHASGTHVFDSAPTLGSLGQVLGQKIPALILAIVALIAAFTGRLDLRRVDARTVIFCASLALIPILLLYGVSVGTSVHVFVFRYRLVAVPGVALCWALAASRITSRGLRLIFCLVFVIVASCHYIATRSTRLNNYTWKYALAFAEKSAAPDQAPVLICSDLPESDYDPMPTSEGAKDNFLFPQISYFQPNIQVIPLPRALNREATRIGSEFLAQSSRRFLAVGFQPSYPTLKWLAELSDRDYRVREIGDFNGIRVIEFVPRTGP